MKRRKPREIEILSMSAIDLFAAAMAAFALLTVVLMPYYQKEVVERTPENAIADLQRAAETSSVKSIEQRKALEKKVSASTAAVSDIKSKETELLAKLRGAEATLLEKRAAAERVVEIPEPIAKKPGPTPAKAKIDFRFLGMKTTKNNIAVALDLNRCMGGHEKGVNKAVSRVITSLQPNHRLSILGFQQTDSGPYTRSWPAGGGMRTVTGSSQAEAIRFTENLTRRFSGSSSMLYAFDKLASSQAEAIFLISDGLPNPKYNNGLRPMQLADEITRRNAGRKEIHTVIVGSYFDYNGTVEFMEKLARNNGGQFMALASADRGVCG
jgi:hypothetical protein